MSFAATQRIQARLQQEEGTLFKPGAPVKVGLAYPNHYFFGMSNLGFQSLYKIFNQEKRVVCERLFLPEDDLLGQMGPHSLTTYEHGIPSHQLQMLAFSISYQNDALNVIPMLHLMGLAHRAAERDEHDPLIIAGGPALTINPEPLSPIMDAIVLGEGEEVARAILEILEQSPSKAEQLQALDKLEGVYVPSLYENPYGKGSQAIKATEGFGLVSGQANGTPQTHRLIRRLVVKNPEGGLAQTEVLTPDTEFGDLYLLEVQRGCQWGCRFCAAGFMYRYPRYDTVEQLKRRIDHGLRYRNKVGLIAGDLLGHEAIEEVLSYVDQQGGGFSPSSVRLNAFTPTIIHYLKKSGNRTIAIAPEAGSERLRRSLNKTFTQEEIVESAVQLAEGGIQHIKLYIMIGLPTETEADIAELCELTVATRQALARYAKKTGRMPELTLSVSPFVPKPSTPLQYEPFAGMKSLKKNLQTIRHTLLPKGHIRITGESVLDAYVETLLSRGDATVLEFLEQALQPVGKALAVGNPGHLKQVLKNLSFDPDFFVTRRWNPQEPTPWDFIDHGVKQSFYTREIDKFKREKITPYCRPEVCRSCGVC